MRHEHICSSIVYCMHERPPYKNKNQSTLSHELTQNITIMSSLPIRTDAKIVIPSSQGIAYRIGALNDKRGVLDDFAPSIPELDVDTFIASLLPPLPDGVNIEEIVEELIGSNDLVMLPTAKRFYWSAFPTDPANSGSTENKTFAALINVYNAVMKDVPANLQANKAISKLVSNPDRVPYSQRTHRTRPDAYMILNESSVNSEHEYYYWEDVAVTMEFKKSNSDNDRSDVGCTSTTDSNGYQLTFVCQNMKKCLGFHAGKTYSGIGGTDSPYVRIFEYQSNQIELQGYHASLPLSDRIRGMCDTTL